MLQLALGRLGARRSLALASRRIATPATHGPTYRPPFVSMAAAVAVASASFVSLAYAEETPKPKRIAEPATGILFDERFCVSPNDGCPVVFDFELVGTGCRYKYGYIKVYAVGVYMPTTRPVQSGKDALAAVLDGRLRCVVDVRMYRSVDKPALVQAIDEAVRTRVAAKAATLPVEQKAREMQQVDELTRILSANTGASLEPGHNLSFFWSGHSHDTLMIEVNGKIVGSVTSRLACWALFDTYLGADSVSPSVKVSIAVKLDRL